MNIEPVTLEGRTIALVPLLREHVDGGWKAGSDPEIWKLTTAKVHSREDMVAYIETALGEQARGVSLPFTTILRATGEVVGMTRFGSIAREHKRVEIGWTFVTPLHQRTAVNTEAKYLMLRHAFEVWGCNRVELKTGSLNSKSRNAMLRIGAKEEGILRQHIINADGFVRDTVYFSVIAGEWPEVKAGLEEKLSRS
ncbi:MAG: GNAT family N-acetyltransferase [Bryobacteraceae bacterium]|nr:GNAT family N-acetyltransferase [Bryobacteraceae bacterium]